MTASTAARPHMESSPEKKEKEREAVSEHANG